MTERCSQIDIMIYNISCVTSIIKYRIWQMKIKLLPIISKASNTLPDLQLMQCDFVISVIQHMLYFLYHIHSVTDWRCCYIFMHGISVYYVTACILETDLGGAICKIGVNFQLNDLMCKPEKWVNVKVKTSSSCNDSSCIYGIARQWYSNSRLCGPSNLLHTQQLYTLDRSGACK